MALLRPHPFEPDRRNLSTHPAVAAYVAQEYNYVCAGARCAFQLRWHAPPPEVRNGKPGRNFHVDHIIRLEHGGKDEISNMQPLCATCHALKTRVEQCPLERAVVALRVRYQQDGALPEFLEEQALLASPPARATGIVTAPAKEAEEEEHDGAANTTNELLLFRRCLKLTARSTFPNRAFLKSDIRYGHGGEKILKILASANGKPDMQLRTNGYIRYWDPDEARKGRHCRYYLVTDAGREWFAQRKD